jgi:hypothetical protein
MMPVAVMLLVVGAQLAGAAPAFAQAQMEFIPSLSLFTVYDDNIFARVDGTAGQMQQLRPSFEGSYESPTVRLLGLYSFDMQRSNFSSLNTLDARRHALGETRLRTSPFTTLGLAMRYDRSETPGEIETETGVLGERREAERLELTPTLARRLTPRMTLTSGYNWTTERLIDGERGTLHAARIALARDVTPRTALTGSYIGRYFVADEAPTIDGSPEHSSHALLVGVERQIAPGTRLGLSAGPKATSYDGPDVEVNVGFARTTPRLRTAIDYWHGETIVLGIGGPVALDSVTTRVNWPFRHRMEFGVHTGVSDLATLDGRAATIYRGTLVGSWSPSERYTFAATYGLDFQDGTIRFPVFLDGEALPLEDRLLRHVVRVSVTVAPRYRRSILPPEEAARAKGVTR